MEAKIIIKQQEDNSFEIKKGDEVIGKLVLDPNHRSLARLFEQAPKMIELLTEGMQVIKELEDEAFGESV